MLKQPESVAAEDGSLTNLAVRGLALIQEFYIVRDRRIRDLVGRKYRRSPLREELMRQITFAFADRKLLRVVDYQKMLADFGSRSLVRTEIDILYAESIVILRHSQSSERATVVVPTNKLISHFNRQVPDLIALLGAGITELSHMQAKSDT